MGISFSRCSFNPVSVSIDRVVRVTATLSFRPGRNQRRSTSVCRPLSPLLISHPLSSPTNNNNPASDPTPTARAISAHIPGLEVTIEADGTTLREFDFEDLDPAPDTPANTITKHLEAPSGAEFAIRYTYKAPFIPSFRIDVDITLDGQLVLVPEIYFDPQDGAESWICGSTASAVDGKVFSQKFRFSELTIGDKHQPVSETLKQQLALVGKISLAYCLSAPQEKNDQLFSEIRNIGVHPFATFVFEYCSTEALKNIHIIERTPPPTPPIPLEDRNLDDIQTLEEMREVARRLKELQDNARKIKKERDDVFSYAAMRNGKRDWEDEVECKSTGPARRLRRESAEGEEVVPVPEEGEDPDDVPEEGEEPDAVPE